MNSPAQFHDFRLLSKLHHYVTTVEQVIVFSRLRAQTRQIGQRPLKRTHKASAEVIAHNHHKP